jgi:sterol desaturase/sphingolipid hydroxylase (fatty acid hydroxylase superfamily)
MLKFISKLVLLLLLLEGAYRCSRYINTFTAHLPIGRYAGAITVFLCITAVIAFLERMWPASGQRNYSNFRFALISILMATFCSPLVSALASALPSTSLTPLNVFLKDGPPVARAIMGTLLFVGYIAFADFFMYWSHRASHKFSILWRLHRLHHAIRPMNCLGFYVHPLDHLIFIPVVALPAALLRIDAPEMFILSAFLVGWNQFAHSDTRITLGPLRAIFTDNAVHRLHHSARPEHFNCNFSQMFSVWDRVFGTYVDPSEEWPEAGLAELAPAGSVKEYLSIPFRRMS